MEEAQEAEVAREENQRDLGEGGAGEQGELVKAEEVDEEVEFVAGAVVDADGAAKGGEEVGR